MVRPHVTERDQTIVIKGVGRANERGGKTEVSLRKEASKRKGWGAAQSVKMNIFRWRVGRGEESNKISYKYGGEEKQYGVGSSASSGWERINESIQEGTDQTYVGRSAGCTEKAR